MVDGFQGRWLSSDVYSEMFFLKNLKLIKNNDNALPKTKPLYSHIKLENYVHAA